MKIVFLDAATLGDTSLQPIEALGELVTYPVSSPEEALEIAKGHFAVCPERVLRLTKSHYLGELADTLTKSCVWYLGWK